QYLEWIRNFLVGDLGKSYRYDQPAWDIIRPLIPVTLELAVLSTLVAICIGVPTGVISAIRPEPTPDYPLRLFRPPRLSMPAFWVGMVIIPALVSDPQWNPPVTYVGPRENLWLHIV